MDIKAALTIAFTLLVFFGLAAWIISTVLVFIIRWLPKQKQVQRLVMLIRQSWLSWWNRHRADAERLWEVLWEIFIDPLLFAFVVFALFNRITSITDYTAAHPGTNFWTQINLDMESNMSFYMFFLFVFTIWMMGKAWVRLRQETEQKTIRKALEANTKVLEAIARQMGIPESEYKVTDTNTKPDTTLDQYTDF